MENKVVLVTGASSGIGKAIASYLAEKGFVVYGTSRKAKDNEDGIRFIKMDVTDKATVKNAIKNIIEEAGSIDVLVNNAGTGIIGALEECDSEVTEYILQTNFHGMHNVCREVLPYMRNQNSGKIINISSIAGEVGLPYRGIYSASKFAVEGFTEALSMEMKSFNIKAVIVQPGDYRTNINQTREEIPSPENSAYKPYMDKILTQVNQEVHASRDPVEVAATVYKVIRKKNPRIRYRCGALMQRMTPVLKHLLPYRLFEKLIRNHYQLK